jgi:hypothetical protein
LCAAQYEQTGAALDPWAPDHWAGARPGGGKPTEPDPRLSRLAEKRTADIVGLNERHAKLVAAQDSDYTRGGERSLQAFIASLAGWQSNEAGHSSGPVDAALRSPAVTVVPNLLIRLRLWKGNTLSPEPVGSLSRGCRRCINDGLDAVSLGAATGAIWKVSPPSAIGMRNQDHEVVCHDRSLRTPNAKSSAK